MWYIDVKHVEAIPYLNVAPTGNKQYNGLAERTVRTLKTLEELITSHLKPFYKEKYLKLAFLYAAQLYNRSPHTGVHNEFPFGKYYKRKPKLFTDEEKAEKQQYLSGQPGHLFLNIKRTLPELPMFLEDGCYPIQQNHKTVLKRCFFVGYDENDCILVMTIPQGRRVHPKLDKTTQFVRFGTFNLHQGGTISDETVNTVYLSYESTIPYDPKDVQILSGSLMSLNESLLCVTDSTHESSDVPSMVPKNFQDALKQPEWLQALQKEIDSFLEHKVYKEVFKKEQYVRYLHTFWIFTRKLNGTAKARLITIDPKTVGHKDTDASSPVAKSTTINLMFVIFTMRSGLTFSVHDITTAFLNSVVSPDEIYYVRTPLGFGSYFQTKYVQMLKYAYGLNLSPLKFHETLCSKLTPAYTMSLSDRCFHTNKTKDELIAHHVDDLLVLSKNPETFENNMKGKFTLKSSRQAESYLGADFHHTQAGITVSVSTYLEKAIDGLHPLLQEAIKIHTIKPFVESIHLSSLPEPTQEALAQQLETAEEEDLRVPKLETTSCYELDHLNYDQISLPIVQPPTTEQRVTKRNAGSNQIKTPLTIDELFSIDLYRSLLGILTYIATKGRFDIQVYTSLLAQFTAMPSLVEFRQAVHLLSYCYSTRKSGCHYAKGLSDIPFTQKLNIDVYTDASDKKTQSQGGYIILVNGFYVNSKSYRLAFLTKSSFEAEILALRVGVVQGLSLIPTLKDMGYKKVHVRAFCDNSAVIKRVNGTGSDAGEYSLVYRNCLIALHWYAKHKRITLDHIDGKVNPADLLTKPLNSYNLLQLLENSVLAKAFQLKISGPSS